MKDEKIVFTEEELDFIREMMNIGAGNAATALEQMLGFKTDMKIPLVKKIQQTEIGDIYQYIGESTQNITAVFMDLVGQVRGKIIFVVPDKDLVKLVSLAERATPGGKKLSTDLDLSVVAEIGNILAGMYLTSIHDFCMLNVYHSIPKIKSGMLKTLLLGLFPKGNYENSHIIMVINEFVTASDRISTYVLLVPDPESMKLLAHSIQEAKDKLSVP
jgi:chemotaxis protein CheC